MPAAVTPLRVDLTNITELVTRSNDNVVLINTRMNEIEMAVRKILESMAGFSERVGDAENAVHMLTKKVNDDEMRVIRRVDMAVDVGVTSAVNQMKNLCEEQLRERLDVFQAQLRGLIHDVKLEQNAVQQQAKEQLSYHLELSAREMRREFVDTNARLESAEKLIEEAIDLKRHVADLDGVNEGISRRMDMLHNEVLQRHSSTTGLKGRVETLEVVIQNNRSSVLQVVEELRNEVDAKCDAVLLSRVDAKTDTLVGEFKAFKANNAKVEMQVAEFRTLYQTVQDLNNRITNVIGDVESSAVGTGAEIGGFKGQMDSFGHRLGLLEVRTSEFARGTQTQMADLLTSLQSHSENLVTNRCTSLEAKVAQKLDAILLEGKQWRGDNNQLISLVEEKLEDAEQQIQKLHSQVEGSVLERISQNTNEVRDIARRVDIHLSDRKELHQELRKELSNTQEIIKGLQFQYDSLLNDSLQRNNSWTEISRDLRQRVERAEGQIMHWNTMLETTLDDLRVQSSSLITDQMANIAGQIDVNITDVKKAFSQIQRLEDDCRVAARGLGELDERIQDEFREQRELIFTAGREITTMKGRFEALDNKQQNDGVRMAKAVLDVDMQCSQHFRELKDIITEVRNDSELLKRNFAGLETKVNISSTCRPADISSELTTLRDEMGTATDKVAAHMQRMEAFAQKADGQQQQLESFTRALQLSVEELKHALGHSIQELQNNHADLNASLSTAVAKFDPSLKRVDSQIQQLTKSTKELGITNEKVQTAMADLQSEFVQTQLEVNSVGTKVESLLLKPMATESALRTVQNEMISSIQRVSHDINTVQSLFHEMHEKFSVDVTGKTKSIANAVMQLQHKAETAEVTHREYQTTVSSLVDDLRATLDDKLDVLGRRAEGQSKDLQALKAAGQKTELKVREAILKDLQQLQARVEEKFAKWDDKILVDIEQLKSTIDGMRQAVEEQRKQHSSWATKTDALQTSSAANYKAVLDMRAAFEPIAADVGNAKNAVEHLRSLLDDYRKSVLLLAAKQDSVDGLQSFGIDRVKEIQQQFNQLSDEWGVANERARADMEKHVRAMCERYEKRLAHIQERSEQIVQISSVSSRIVQDIHSRGEETRERIASVEHEVYALRERSGSPAAARAPSAGPFGGAGSAISSLSGAASQAKPGVGFDCRDTPEGVAVSFVKDGGPGAIAGIQLGDFITAVNGSPISSRSEYKAIITLKQPGELVHHVITRGSEKLYMTIILGTARLKR